MKIRKKKDYLEAFQFKNDLEVYDKADIPSWIENEIINGNIMLMVDLYDLTKTFININGNCVLLKYGDYIAINEYGNIVVISKQIFNEIYEIVSEKHD